MASIGEAKILKRILPVYLAEHPDDVDAQNIRELILFYEKLSRPTTLGHGVTKRPI